MNGKEDRKDPVPAAGFKGEPTLYDDFVEGVATRDIAKAHGVEKTAKVFKQVDKDGDVIHICGDKNVVSDIGNTLEKGGYRVKEWHIKRPADPEKEAEKVGPALEELGRSLPTKGLVARLHRGLEEARERLGLPSTIFDRAVGRLVSGEEVRLKAGGKVDEIVESAMNKAIEEIGREHGFKPKEGGD
jgi:hypothetical protein